MKIYAGIGSREVLDSMVPTKAHGIARQLAKLDFMLRSGAAPGMDTFFEEGCDRENGKKEIFYPFPIEGRTDKPTPPTPESMEMARRVIPHWHKLSWGAKQLHGRNPFQVLGLDLKTPVDVVVTWTEGGRMKGGTRTALVIAEEWDIPIFNLGLPTMKNKPVQWFLEEILKVVK